MILVGVKDVKQLSSGPERSDYPSIVLFEWWRLVAIVRNCGRSVPILGVLLDDLANDERLLPARMALESE